MKDPAPFDGANSPTQTIDIVLEVTCFKDRHDRVRDPKGLFRFCIGNAASSQIGNVIDLLHGGRDRVFGSLRSTDHSSEFRHSSADRICLMQPSVAMIGELADGVTATPSRNLPTSVSAA